MYEESKISHRCGGSNVALFLPAIEAEEENGVEDALACDDGGQMAMQATLDNRNQRIGGRRWNRRNGTNGGRQRKLRFLEWSSSIKRGKRDLRRGRQIWRDRPYPRCVSSPSTAISRPYCHHVRGVEDLTPVWREQRCIVLAGDRS